MLKAISTYVHIKERLHPGILDRLAKGGVAGIEIFAMRGHFDYTNSQQVREIASWFRSQDGVELLSMHAPMYSGDGGSSEMMPLNVAGRDRKERIDAMDEIKRAIEVAEVAPFASLVLHIGVGGESFDEHKFEHALTSVEHLRAFAKPLGVRLLLENIPNELTAPEKLMNLIQTLHYDDIGICLDLGHANLEPGVEAAIETMKTAIRSVHVHDNRGNKDEHLWPGEGTIDWKPTMELLKTAPQVPALVLEIEGDPEGNPEYGKTVPGKIQKSWELLQV
ncbi:MAG TPA: sugar phosphate isomerase/epimerase family protein [Candidatus Saccharimonadales bacterium]|nr:sugar phosphate isomerase/epimerase family protein [Candidatus Saccharimonadales bacterium]